MSALPPKAEVRRARGLRIGREIFCNLLIQNEPFGSQSGKICNQIKDGGRILIPRFGGSSPPAPASQSCLSHKAPVSVEDAAIPRHMPRTTLSLCLGFGRECAITAFCLRGQFLASRFAGAVFGLNGRRTRPAGRTNQAVCLATTA
jgi:hypothetical protein